MHPSERGADRALLDQQTLRDYVRIGFKYRWLVAGVSFITLTLTTLYSFLATPMYTAEAKLKIGTYAPLLPGAQLEDSLKQQTREIDYLNTQVESLSSLTIADRVLVEKGFAEELKKYFSKKSGLFSVFTPFRTFLIGSKKQENKAFSGDKSYHYPVNELRAYLSLISVIPLRKTSLVKIAATTSDPQFSAQLANTHADMFIDLVRAERQKSTVENLVFLKNQAQELADKVGLLERNLAVYAEENSIVSLNKDENITVKRMAELNQLLTEATAKRIKSETTFNEAQKGSGLSSSAYDDSSLHDLGVRLKEAESEYAMLSEKFKPSYPKMVQLSARIEVLKSNLKQQEVNATRSLEATYKADFQAERELQSQLEIQKSKAFELSRREVQYNIMKREYESTKDLHQAVLRQLKESQISSESSSSNINLSERAAVPLLHSSPQRGKNILIALLISPVFGYGLALLLESLDNTLKTPEDVQRSLGLPSLGVVPLFALFGHAPVDKNDESETRKERFQESFIDTPSSPETQLFESQSPEVQPGEPPSFSMSSGLPASAKRESDLIMLRAPRSIASEAFRTIRTGILLSSADHPPKVILVTSGKKSEGKTTLATNLSATLAQSANRTIIIDADLRRPALHRSFGIESKTSGLVDYLTGQKSLDQVIRMTPVDGLFVIPAGPIPPNPSELLGSKKMADLIEELRQEFDYVIIDTPPVLPVTDAVLLSRAVDGVVLVVRGQETQKQVAKEAASRLQQAGARILGVVLNDVDFRSGDYYYYYRDTYSYYYTQEEGRSSRRRKRAVG